MSCLQILQFCISGIFNKYTFNKLFWIMNTTYKALIKSVIWKLLNIVRPDDFCGKLRFFTWRNIRWLQHNRTETTEQNDKGKKGLGWKYQQCVANPKSSVVKAESWETSAQNTIFKTMAVSTSDICSLGNLRGWGEGNYTALTSAYIPNLQFNKQRIL